MRTIIITVEVYDDTTVEKMERVVDNALNNMGIDCTYEVKEK